MGGCTVSISSAGTRSLATDVAELPLGWIGFDHSNRRCFDEEMMALRMTPAIGARAVVAGAKVRAARAAPRAPLRRPRPRRLGFRARGG